MMKTRNFTMLVSFWHIDSTRSILYLFSNTCCKHQHTHINFSINPLLNYLLFANQGTIREEKPVPPPTLIALWILHPTVISPYPFTASPGKRNSDADSDISYTRTITTKNIQITHYNIHQHLYWA